MSEARRLSTLQQAMIVQEALADRPLYTMQVCVAVHGRVDGDALERALHHVQRRHPVLSSTYDGEVASPWPGALPGLRRVTDPSPADAPVLEELWDTQFDLAAEPPVRAVLVSDSPDNHVIGMAVHHVAGDSWSIALVLREIGAAYAALVDGAPPDTDPAPDFFDHAGREAQHGDVTWWRDRLCGVRPGPRTGSSAGPDRYRVTVIDLGLDADDTRDVREMAQAGRVSPTVVLFAAVSAAVSAAVAADRCESVVGLTAVLRDTTSAQATVGPLINTLPVRAAWPRGLCGAGLLAAHAEALDDALAHKHVPYPEILRAAGVARRPGAGPLPMHVVNADTVLPYLPLPGTHTAVRPVSPRWAKVPALWEFGWGRVGNVRGALRVANDFCTAVDASELAGRFRDALRDHLLDQR